MQTDRSIGTAQKMRRPARWCGVVALTLAQALSGIAQAQQLDAMVGPLMETVTEGKGGGEKVIGFRIAKDAGNHRLPDKDVMALSQSLSAQSGAVQVEAARDLGLFALGLTTGAGSALGTFIQHSVWLDALGPTNNALNNIGFALALIQVARDVAKGDDRAAVTGGVKALMSFSISRWGSRTLQIGGVALFVVDVTLTLWQSGLTDIATDIWACRYKAWYKENGRSVGEWKVKAWELYLEAEARGDNYYETFIDGALNSYVGLAFNDDLLASYGDCSASSMGDQARIREIIMAEHKAILRKMLATEVMPEVADRAWLRNLKAQVVWAEANLMPRLNKEFLMEITAYGVEGPARVVMPLPAGGEWVAKLRPEGTFKTKLTLYAVMKAGFPDTIRLETDAGVQERKLVLQGDQVTALFGAPETPMVSRYRLSEGAQSCTVKRIAADGSVTVETTGSDARPAQPVDFGMLANGNWVVGKFSAEGGWSLASPGVVKGSSTMLGAPLFDDIRAFKGCNLGMFEQQAMVALDCSVERYERKVVSARVTIERICTSSAKLDLIGAFAPLDDDPLHYFAMDDAAAKAAAEVMKKALEGGGQSFDMNAIPGMP